VTLRAAHAGRDHRAVSEPILRFGPTVWLEPKCFDELVDCRQLFTGDRNRALLRAYPEAMFRLSRTLPPPALARFVRASDEILQFYDVHEEADRVGLVMRDEIFRTQASLDDLEYELHVGDGPREVHYPLPLERFAALGRLVPLLIGNHTESAVRTELRNALAGDDLAWADALLSRLLADGFLERGPFVPNTFQAGDRPRVTFVAHTSLLVQSQQTNVVFDPLFRKTLGFPHAGVDVCRLALGAIALSHAHWDHADVASLLLFDKKTPVLIPKVIEPTIFNPPMVGMLQRLGFTDIREVEHWTPVQIGDIDIIPVPFHGEQDEPDAVIDHFTYVVRANGWTMYGGVDSFQDTFGDMREDFERVRREYQPTIAFLPVSRMTYSFRHGGVNGYCHTVDTTLLGKSFQYTADPELAVEWVRLLDAKFVIPYATFTFRKNEPAIQAAEFGDAMRKAGMADRVIALRPLDMLSADDLSGGSSAASRRAFLFRWQKTMAHAARIDRRMQKKLPYRMLKRLLGRNKPPAQHHH
jgi:L-ascorbate metabolism protein UlaG (beta-lactamase superfamily)